ncbi:MAG TPA: discoidin domain-containing protein [Thermoanaerobaculia bacterium]|nr:discoidin domain-containing protein [Thermoanaerobaculia bacterium]
MNGERTARNAHRRSGRRPHRSAFRVLRFALFALVLAGGALGWDAPLDDFSDLAQWEAVPAEGVKLEIHSDAGFRGRGMRMDIDFSGHGGYAIARREVGLELPENWEFTFRIRGDLPRNNLEFKLIDPSGENVWWVVRREFEFTDEWQLVRVRRRHIGFAWGPRGGGTIERVGAIEFAISVGNGGRGSVWIDELDFREREPERPYDLTPVATASSASAAAPFVLDGDPATAWKSSASTGWIALDFLREREYGGAMVRWGEPFALDYDVETSDDGRAWTVAREVRGSNGGRDHLFLPETASRHLRLRLRVSSARRGFEVREIEILPLEIGDSKTALFRRIAADSPPGSFPKYLGGVQSWWTVAGAPADDEEILVNEEGMIEVGGVGGFSIEPFVGIGEELVTWANVSRIPSLAEYRLPIPSVEWSHPSFGLKVTALAGGEPGRSAARAIYRLENRSARALETTLYVAIRPFQVNPPWQFLNIVGGYSEILRIDYEGSSATVHGVRTRTLTALPPPDAFGAGRFDSGSIVEHLREGRVPAEVSVADPFRAASAAFAWRLALGPGAAREVAIEIPLHAGAPAAPPPEAVASSWTRMLGRVGIELPPSAAAIERTLESNLAYVLVNQDGPAIQPGSRAYDRSWIRDGSLTSAALLRFGHADAVRRFIEWYVGFQGDDGRVPCCVGKRGGDPVPEHDSHGQLIYAIAEYVRQTGDLSFGAAMWPHVVGAVDYIDDLRHQRMTGEYREGEKRAYYGLMPESISHEGYSAKPMHSYWDQLFGLKGLKDAAWLASELVAEVCSSAPGLRRAPEEGDEPSCGALERERARISGIRDAFRDDLRSSIALAMEMHGIDWVPGSVELGDFDATSTTVALDPVDAVEVFPPGALERTFEKYWESFVARREGAVAWEAYTPYEHRVVGAFVRLGWIDRAHEALDWFMDDRRPPQWNHWAEVVWNDPDTPEFIGDMPHTWVGSDFIRSLVDFLAYERESDRSLVIAAGIVEPWAREGVRIRGLRTHYGPLSYSIAPDPHGIRVEIEAGVDVPPGGIVFAAPFLDEPRTIRSLPARFVVAEESRP